MDMQDFINEYTLLREQITLYDKKILKLLDKRITLAKKLIQLKKEHGNPVYNYEIEKEKIQSLSKLSNHPGLIELIWPCILLYTRNGK